MDEKAVTIDLLDRLSARRTDVLNSLAKNTYVIVLMMKNATLKQTGIYQCEQNKGSKLRITEN